MARPQKTILVTGATGQQGGATAKHLNEQGWRVRALVRNPESAAARGLAKLGVTLVVGDMEDRASLDAALAGAYGVFSLQPAGGTSPGYSDLDAVRWGLNVAAAAKAAGVAHFVYTSVGGPRAPAPLFQYKRTIERGIRELGLAATILQPVSFMENCLTPHHLQAVTDGVMRTPIAPQATVQYIAAHDIGAFAALAFAQPETFVGEDLEIAGDELTPLEVVDALSRVTGRPIEYIHAPLPPEGALNDSSALAASVRRFAPYIDWINGEGNTADIPRLRRLLPDLLDFNAWLARQDRTAFAALFGQGATA